MFDEIKNIKSQPCHLRQFGFTIGVVLLVLGAIALWRSKTSFAWFFVFGSAFIGLGAFRPALLKSLQKAWMALGIVIGFFTSRVILAIVFYVIITPIGLVLRILGKDVLDQRIQRSRNSYWIKRSTAVKPKESYENQY